MRLLITPSYTGSVDTERRAKKMVRINKGLGKVLKRQRLSVPLTVRKLAMLSGISPSYLGRIERGERFPSASILRKIAGPLGMRESELFSLAGYLSPESEGIKESASEYTGGIDPYVRRVLSSEPVEGQRAGIGV